MTDAVDVRIDGRVLWVGEVGYSLDHVVSVEVQEIAPSASAGEPDEALTMSFFFLFIFFIVSLIGIGATRGGPSHNHVFWIIALIADLAVMVAIGGVGLAGEIRKGRKPVRYLLVININGSLSEWVVGAKDHLVELKQRIMTAINNREDGS